MVINGRTTVTAASEAVIRDRVISVRMRSGNTEITQMQTTATRQSGREGCEECVECGKVEVVYEELLNENDQNVIGY